jgi:DNA-binding response OmpR family regulator
MKTILVVESSRPIEGLSGSLFRRRECVLAVASSAAEAIARCGDEPPDLLILDALVDDFSVEDLVQALQSSEETADVPVLVVLDEEREAEEGRLLRSGAAAVVLRSADEVELNSKVCELLGISLRRHLRTFVKLKVEATVGKASRFATIANISLGGVALETDARLQVDDFVKLQFFLPGDDEAIAVIGKVVRQGSAETGRAYGCQFLDLTEDGRRRIHRFVTSAEGDAD